MSDQRQETDVLEYCQKNGYTIATDAFREKISGTIRNRKAMTEAIEYAKANEIKYLICSELSRLGRSNETNDIIEDLTKEDICVITLKENISTMKYNEKNEWVKDDDAIFLVGILTAINKKESDTIGYRIASGKRNSVYNKGAFTGGKYVPYGYESIEGVLTINDKEAERIKQIFKLYCDGWGAVKIANFLNLNNYATRTIESKWSRGTINNILYNTIYIGQRKYKGDTIHNEELRIVDDITFNTVQQRRSQWKNANNEFKITRKYDYLFDQRIIKCANCGKHYFGIVDSKKKRNYYKCVSGKYAKGCGNSAVNKDILEQKIISKLPVNIGIPDYDEQLRRYESELQLYKSELSTLMHKKERYGEIYAMGNISKAKYIKKIEQNNNTISKLQEQIAIIEEKITNTKTLEDSKDYLLRIKEMDKAFLHKFIKNIIIHPKDNNKHQKVDIIMISGDVFSFNL
jgi:site-specific DNA recombinase